MAKIDLLDQKWIDLVFEGKNEAYGAYKIRQNTSNRNNLAMLILLLGLAAIVGIYFAWGGIANAIAASEERNEGTEALEMVVEEQEEVEDEEEIVYDIQPEEEQVQQDQLMNSEKFTDYAMDDEAPQEVTKTQEETEKSDVAISSVNFDQGSDEGEQVLKQNQVVVEKVEEKEDDKIYEFHNIEQMPRFPGDPGDNSVLLQWLGKNTKYPPVAEENGIQGRVTCTFVVEKDGSITDVRVVKSVDPSLDKEAVRVIKSMPHWLPGKQNGHAVRVKFTLPVTFKLQ